MNRRVHLLAWLTLASGACAFAADPAPTDNPPPPAEAAPAETPQTAADENAPAAASSPHDDLVAERDRLASNLSTALRSYTLLRDENDRLKTALDSAQSEKAALEQRLADAETHIKTLSEQLKRVSATASEADLLREQARQTQAQAAALAEENNQLKTRLALLAPPPGSTLASPNRPGAAPAVASPPSPAAAEPATPPAAPPSERTHTVVLGDTLRKIARQYYGDVSRWREILEANRDVITNEDALVVGAKLRIP